MAKRKNNSLIDDLLDFAASISWKASISLAIISYVSFHYVAAQPLLPTKNISSLTHTLFLNLFITFSGTLQYLIPFVFILGVVVSVLKRKRRRKLLDMQSSIESIRSLSWQEFELLVAEAFRRKGFKVTENGGGGADGGIDLILQKDGKKSIVQCKRWKTFSIGVPLIRELYGVMTAEEANDCVFVSSGNYTTEARLFAEEKPIWLIDGSELLKLVSSTQIKPSINQPNLNNPFLSVPVCPVCNSTMVKRVAKKGTYIGKEFWGCSMFPKCKGTIQI